MPNFVAKNVLPGFRDMAPKAPNKLRKKLQRKEQEIVEAPHSVASKAPNGNPLCCVPKGKTLKM